MSGQLDIPCRREFKDKPSSQWSASLESARASREVGGVENVGKRQFAVRCHVQVWGFDVENDDDVRDAAVADIVEEMEKFKTETPAQEAEENEVEVNELTASPPSLAQLYTMFSPIQELGFSI